MSQTFLAADMGAAANDGSGTKIRDGGLKIAADLAELYAAVALLEGDLVTAQSLLRSKLAETCNGTEGQVIGFSSEFASVYALSIIDYEGIGISVTAQDENGFTITSLSAGNFGYIAMIEV
jgi:hypothetical protein